MTTMTTPCNPLLLLYEDHLRAARAYALTARAAPIPAPYTYRLVEVSHTGRELPLAGWTPADDAALNAWSRP